MSHKQNSGHSVEILLFLVLLTVAGECDCSVLDMYHDAFGTFKFSMVIYSEYGHIDTKVCRGELSGIPLQTNLK